MTQLKVRKSLKPWKRSFEGARARPPAAAWLRVDLADRERKQTLGLKRAERWVGQSLSHLPSYFSQVSYTLHKTVLTRSVKMPGGQFNWHKKSRDIFQARFWAETQANFSTVFSILHLGPIFGTKFMSIAVTPCRPIWLKFDTRLTWP